jgi:NADPH:quinone reductase-like Zn-dependent oxidoreductase
VPLPSNVPYEFGASLGCEGITAIHAVISIGKVSLGDSVIVYSTDGERMYILQLAKLSGATMTIAIVRTEEKLRMAQENFVVDEIINISTEKLRDSKKRITAGKGVDVVFDFVVNNDSIDNSLKILANPGKLGDSRSK